MELMLTLTLAAKTLTLAPDPVAPGAAPATRLVMHGKIPIVWTKANATKWAKRLGTIAKLAANGLQVYWEIRNWHTMGRF